MLRIEDIYNLIAQECAVIESDLKPNTDIFEELGVVGDDFSELIEEYSKQFDVRMESYRWYFHGNDEGYNPLAYIFKPPNEKVERIPVTPKMLLDFAHSKEWGLNYPDHDEPTDRRDLTYSNIGLLVIFLIIFLLVVANT
jgi:hypothetical protein